MKIEYLTTLYRKNTSNKNLTDEEKLDVLSKIVTPKKYMPFKDKQKMVKQTIITTVKSEGNFLRFNSCDKYYTFICNFIAYYYSIDMNIDTYDKLCEEGLLNLLIALVGTEYEICVDIMNCYMDDIKSKFIDLESLCDNE